MKLEAAKNRKSRENDQCWEKYLNLIDENRDGKISKDEFVTYFKKLRNREPIDLCDSPDDQIAN